MKQFTIADIRSWSPCYDPGRYLPEDWSGTALDILNLHECPFKDRLWVIMRTDFVSEKLMRRFPVWCARQVQHLMTDERSLHALDVMDAYCEWRFDIDDPDWKEGWELERVAAWYAAMDAWAATMDAKMDATRLAATEAARAAACAAAMDAAMEAARAAARNAAMAAAWDATREAAQSAQEAKLREMLIEGVETGDVK